MNTDRQKIEYKITITDSQVQIEPSTLVCIMSDSPSASEKVDIFCGKDISFEISESKKLMKSSDSDYSLELAKIKGTVNESWLLHKDIGIAIVTVYGDKNKTYTGIVKKEN